MSSQEELGRPLRSLVRHTLVYGSGYVTMAVASFVLVPIYTRHFAPSGYGLLGLMLVLYGLMSQVYDFGFTNSVGRFFFESTGPEQPTVLRTMRATAGAFLAVFGGLLTAALWFGAREWSQLLTQSTSHADLVRVVAITLYAEGLALVPLTLIRMQERSRLYVAITLARFTATLALSILFVVVLRWGVRGALEANAASAIAVLILLLPEYALAIRGRLSRTLLREMLAFGVPFFPVILSAWFIEASDRYLLGIYRSHAEVGWYVLGYKVAQVMQISLAAFSMGWAPLRYRIYKRADAGEVYRRLATFYVLSASLLIVALGVFARLVVDVIAPHSYAPAATIVPLIALGYGLNGLYILMVTGMGVAKKTGPMFWIVGGAAAANLGINILLIPVWGMRAAAWTTVLANAIMIAGGWYYSQKVYRIPYDWPRIARVTVIGAVIVSACVWLAPGRGLGGIAAATLAWLAFVALLIRTRTLPANEIWRARDQLRGWWPEWRKRFARAGLAP